MQKLYLTAIDRFRGKGATFDLSDSRGLCAPNRREELGEVGAAHVRSGLWSIRRRSQHATQPGKTGILRFEGAR